MKNFIAENLKFFIPCACALLVSTGVFANGALVEDPDPTIVIQADPIMRESLRRQSPSAPPPSFAQNQRPQRQQDAQEHDEVEKETIKEMRKQIQALQRQVDNLKRRHFQAQQQSQEEDQSKRITKIVVENGLRSAKEKGTIGRYAIMEGTTMAKRYTSEETTERREIPALQICATLADANKLGKEDFAFLGFDPQVAEKIVDARQLTGGFKSSKQITAVEGVEPEAYQKVSESIIAIEEQRLSE